MAIPTVKSLSVVIPALNERETIAKVIESIPLDQLSDRGWETEILVIDNGSTDGTGAVARSLGARVIVQPVRGYGNAYRAGLANATGSVIVTSDADLTYPLESLPELLDLFERADVEFMTTNRLHAPDRGSMKPYRAFGNRVLSAASRWAFPTGFRDSMSGMWIFRRHILEHLDLRSGGIAFVPEIKHEAYRAGFRCLETPIKYHARGGGKSKLHPMMDGASVLGQLLLHRLRRHRHVQRTDVRGPGTAERAGGTRKSAGVNGNHVARSPGGLASAPDRTRSTSPSSGVELRRG